MRFSSITFLFCFLLFSCTSYPTTPAPWDASPSAIRQVFPDGEYIAQRGSGKTKAAAEVNAASELARFISSQITANRGYEITTGNNSQTANTYDTAFVENQIKISGVRYAQDAYYRRDMKEWCTAAWIERDEAWAVYSPRFKMQSDSFSALYDAAEKEQDQFKKALRFIAADNYAKSDEFTDANLFGQILHPVRMNAEFSSVREKISSIPQRLDTSKRNASVYIDCPQDFESLVSNAFTSRFAALGFPVSNSRNSSSAVCRINVDEGIQQRELGIFYHPSLQAVVSGSSGVVFTFSAEGERVGAVTPDVAKRRAYQSLADKVNNTFSLEIN